MSDENAQKTPTAPAKPAETASKAAGNTIQTAPAQKPTPTAKPTASVTQDDGKRLYELLPGKKHIQVIDGNAVPMPAGTQIRMTESQARLLTDRFKPVVTV